ncbi:MAG: hypothetical protein DI637_08230 [Citromicrobium sp.]|nr:MAG: hypothetical protein DI637_08230 [Citromicrobium sp.]
MLRAALLAVTALALSACGTQQSARFDRYQRALATAPGAAQPSRVVAREIEFLKRARQADASGVAADFAADDAMVLSRLGPQPLTAQSEIELAGWAPSEVWMSCDGRLAVSEGRFQAADSKVGRYLALWQRDRGGDYQWLYRASALDDPQPPPASDAGEVDPDAIVVEGIPSIDGNVADCGATPPPAPAMAGQMRETLSPDGTLAWRWGYTGNQRLIEIHAFTEGEWQRVLARRWPASPGAGAIQ